MDNPYADDTTTNPYATQDSDTSDKLEADIYAPAYQEEKSKEDNIYVQPPYYPPNAGYNTQAPPAYYPQVAYPAYPPQQNQARYPTYPSQPSQPSQPSYPSSPVYVSNPVIDTPQYAQPSIIVAEANADEDPAADEPPKENCCLRAFLIILSIIIPCFGLFVLCCMSKTHPKTAKQCGIISFVLLWIFIFTINMM